MPVLFIAWFSSRYSLGGLFEIFELESIGSVMVWCAVTPDFPSPQRGFLFGGKGFVFLS
ncbi:hypothetical protein [Nonlabens antarcticus]|uniref:hypothetical protein n=1 Tax=Nonlabens antarcticus TaxID=392714 RepID=UPI00189157EC|nr:hypothetical protein [Nonlabens antarcticus]